MQWAYSTCGFYAFCETLEILGEQVYIGDHIPLGHCDSATRHVESVNIALQQSTESRELVNRCQPLERARESERERERIKRSRFNQTSCSLADGYVVWRVLHCRVDWSIEQLSGRLRQLYVVSEVTKMLTNLPLLQKQTHTH